IPGPGPYTRGRRTGRGAHFKLGLQDASLHYIRNVFPYMERPGKPAPRAGSKTVGGGNPPIGVYPCKGGGPNDYVYIYTSRANPEHWNRLLKGMGREDLIGDPRYAHPGARAEHREGGDAVVREWTRQHGKHEAMRLISSATTPAGAVLDTAEIAADRNFQDRGIRQTMQHSTAGEYVMSGWPVRFGGQPPPVAPAPLLGQHGTHVLAEWLKMDTEQIQGLRRDSVIG